MKTLKQQKTLKGLFNLDHNIRVYIPSTINVSEKIDNQKYVDSGLSKLSEYFGGSTSYEAIGAWQSKEKGLVKEKITIVESYGTKEQIEENITGVIEFCEELKKELSQEAISLEYDNKLYFI